MWFIFIAFKLVFEIETTKLVYCVINNYFIDKYYFYCIIFDLADFGMVLIASLILLDYLLRSHIFLYWLYRIGLLRYLMARR